MPNSDWFLKAVAKRIKSRRLELGLTQENMDNGDDGINVRTYQRIENGETDITLSKLFLIAKILETDPKNLLDVPVKISKSKGRTQKPKNH